MFLYGFSFLGCNLIFSLGEIRQNQFPGSFFVAAVFYFAIVIIEPLFLFFSTIFSFSTMFFISMPNFDSLNIINCLVLVVVLVLVGFVHYSISLHRYSTEESLSEANSVLIQMSIYDHLTKLKNRNAWRQDFDNMLGKKCYMMICDIDDFKRFNDTFGHAAGDRVLKTVADCLVDVFGKECCYRFGGDEFIVLTAEPIDDFAFLFQKFEDKLWNSEIEDVDIHPTMSGGCVYGICYDHEAIRRMMQYADEALYRAKDNGKNKLVIDMMYEKKLEKKAVAH
jgi:diguanylate cyclase (GGDEF)-like protein